MKYRSEIDGFRARRLLPALFTVLTVCCVFAVAWMPPNMLTVFARDLIAVSLFGSNIVFWRTSNYFSPRAEENPLLHMWSLAVEEQFYLLFPLLMLMLWRTGSLRLMIIVFVLLFVGSLAISEWGWRNSSIANFFLLPSRIFESHMDINDRMRALDLTFIDLHQIICEGRVDCPIFTEDLRLISHDGGHLTRDGAVYVGQALLEKSDIFHEIFVLPAQ